MIPRPYGNMSEAEKDSPVSSRITGLRLTSSIYDQFSGLHGWHTQEDNHRPSKYVIHCYGQNVVVLIVIFVGVTSRPSASATGISKRCYDWSKKSCRKWKEAVVAPTRRGKSSGGSNFEGHRVVASPNSARSRDHQSRGWSRLAIKDKWRAQGFSPQFSILCKKHKPKEIPTSQIPYSCYLTESQINYEIPVTTSGGSYPRIWRRRRWVYAGIEFIKFVQPQTDARDRKLDTKGETKGLDVRKIETDPCHD